MLFSTLALQQFISICQIFLLLFPKMPSNLFDILDTIAYCFIACFFAAWFLIAIAMLANIWYFEEFSEIIENDMKKVIILGMVTSITFCLLLDQFGPIQHRTMLSYAFQDYNDSLR